MTGRISEDWQAAIDAWTAHARSSGAPETTVRTRREHLSRLARTLGGTGPAGGPWGLDGPRLMVWFRQQPWGCGVRRLRWAGSWDVLDDLAGWSLLVHGKGGKERIAVRARGAGYLFPGADNGHLSPRWVGRLIADLLPAGWTMHKLRHRAATRWWETSQADLFVVQTLLGHASPVTTRAYVAVPDDRLRATVTRAA